MQRCQFFVIMYLFLQTKALLLLADLTFLQNSLHECCQAGAAAEAQSLSLPVLLVVLPFHC